jgi:hypothetical protein
VGQGLAVEAAHLDGDALPANVEAVAAEDGVLGRAHVLEVDETEGAWSV